MKYAFVFLLSAIIVNGYAQKDAPEQALVRLEDQRLKAIIDRDSVTLSSLYDDHYRGVLTTGKQVNKIGVMEFQLSNNPYVKISIENVEAVIYGNVGITTGKQVNRSKSGTILGQSKFIRVYLRNGNGWKIIQSQGTLMPED